MPEQEATILTPGAQQELARLVHGPCTPAYLDTLRRLLAQGPDPGADTSEHRSGNRSGRSIRTLLRLVRGLPPARQLFQDPAQLAALHAWAVVADPGLCMAALVHFQLCLASMVELAPDQSELKDSFEAFESGTTAGSYMVTEVGRSNSHLATRTRAEFDATTREFVLHTPDPEAAKLGGIQIPGLSRTAVVLARLFVGSADCGVFAFVVDISDADGLLPGVEMSSLVEVSSIPLDYAQVRFHQLRLPYRRWLRDSADISDQGVFHDPLGSTDRRLQRTLCTGQALWGVLPSVAAAAGRQAAVLALNYSRQRRTQGRLAPGRPLLEYRAQQHALLGALADAFALTCAAEQARSLWAEASAAGAVPAQQQQQQQQQGDGAMTFSPWAAVSSPLAAYKALAVSEAARITGECRLRCGFSGHLDMNRLTAYHGFFHAFSTAGGDNQLILYDLGRTLALESGPAAGLPPWPEQTDPAWWPTVIRAHEQSLARLLHREQAERTRPERSDFEVWNPLLERAAELGRAHAERLVADDVTRALARVRDPRLRGVLALLAALHGTAAADRWTGSLLSAGTLQPAEVRCLSQRTDRLCDRLLPWLPLLEDAFGYPAEVSGAPLAAADYNRAWASTLTWQQGGAA